MTKADLLHQRLKDRRSRKVIFLSHCILNENTRYLGGACRGGCIQEIVDQCHDRDFGMVQLPCPEQHAWGGVTKKLLLIAYGAKSTVVYRFRNLILPLFLLYTKRIYRQLAKETAHQVNDYLLSGYRVVGVIGIDGSPSCGINTTLDLQKSFDLSAGIDVGSVTIEQMNTIIRESLINGRGLFSALLQEELRKRRIYVPYLAHDLIAELEGRTSIMGTLDAIMK